MGKEKCPCENCICAAVCRYKQYVVLFQDCIMIKQFIPFYNFVGQRDHKKVILLENILQPYEWYTKLRSDELYWILMTKGQNDNFE